MLAEVTVTDSPAGAGPVNVMVPVKDELAATVVLDKLSARMAGGFTVRLAVRVGLLAPPPKVPMRLNLVAADRWALRRTVVGTLTGLVVMEKPCVF